MPRILDRQAVAAAQLENTDEVFLVLMTIKLMPDDADIHIVNNTEDVVSRGVTFIGCPFTLALPDSNDRTVNDASIAIDNVDDRIWKGVQMLVRAPEILLEVIMASQPNDVVMASGGLYLREASATNTTVSGKLMAETVWQAGFPAHDFDPSQNPGIFGT
jgi:hypothetical protein